LLDFKIIVSQILDPNQKTKGETFLFKASVFHITSNNPLKKKNFTIPGLITKPIYNS